MQCEVLMLIATEIFGRLECRLCDDIHSLFQTICRFKAAEHHHTQHGRFLLPNTSAS